jgi:hypothetical protein
MILAQYGRGKKMGEITEEQAPAENIKNVVAPSRQDWGKTQAACLK